VSRRMLLKTLVLAGAFAGLGGLGSAKAQDWTDYLHWPYVPPQVPGNGFQSNALYDRWYLYPREQRIVPQIQGPYYYNFYGGKRLLGFRIPHPGIGYDMNRTWFGWDLTNMRFYEGYHYTLDVF
jgi:hypothetical protein